MLLKNGMVVLLCLLVVIPLGGCVTMFARRCDTCEGTGRRDCGECKGGKIDCPRCSTVFGCSNCGLSTKVSCFICNGVGSFPCRSCSGTGRKKDVN